MLIKLSDITLNIEELRSSNNSYQTIFFLHGFSGSSIDWKSISSKIIDGLNIYAVDLAGHGKSDAPAEIKCYQTDSLLKQLSELLESKAKGKIILAGYSMGGRAALQFAVNFPGKLRGLILESATAGIAEEIKRNERIGKDEQLALFIEAHTIIEFVDYWMNIDLFSSQKKLQKEILSEVREAKLKNSKIGLANSLRGFGTGSMPPVFDSLKKIQVKTLLITGELDSKFTEINLEMAKLFPDVKHQIIKNAGHNVHLEQPAEFCAVINSYLKKL